MCAVAGADLGHDSADVGFGGGRAEDQALGDLVVVEPFGNESDDFAFAVGERGQVAGRGAGKPLAADLPIRVKERAARQLRIGVTVAVAEDSG